MAALASTALAVALSAAAPNPVAWKIEGAPAKPLRPGARFTLTLVAHIEEGWHLYSMKSLPEGPIATKVWIGEGQPFQLAGQIKAPPPQTVQDPNFNMEVEFYEGQVSFSLPVRVAPAAPAGAGKIEINTSYQACNDKLCLPPRTVRVEAPVEIGR
jgi:thiol:disulfide interchange protein DsbD